MRTYRLFVALMLLLGAVAWPLFASAQTKPEPVLIHTGAENKEDFLELSILFSMMDINRRPINRDLVKIEPDAAVQLLTSQSSPVTATIEPATTPIKIALVLDASGSMQQEMADTKAAAIRFVQAAPGNAEIAVFSFADDFIQVQEFTPKEKIALVENGIQSINNKQPGTGDTCVYKAGFGAIDALNKAGQRPQERRAIVLFTDGKDREAGGELCGPIDEPNVISEANLTDRIPIQIHTVGLCSDPTCSNIEVPRLERLAESTFASSRSGTLDQLDDMFKTILAAMDSQFIARANVLAIEGENRANLTFRAAVQDVPGSFSLPTDSFNSAQDYTIPPGAVSITRRVYDQEQDFYTVSLRVTTPEAIKQIDVGSIDQETGTDVPTAQTTTEAISTTMQITQTTAGFVAGRQYCSVVRAINTDNEPLVNADGKEVLSSECGKYEPKVEETVTFDFAGANINLEQHTVDITLANIRAPNGQALVYEGRINDGNRLVKNISQAFLPVERAASQAALPTAAFQVPIPETEREALQRDGVKAAYTLTLTVREEGKDTGPTKTTTASPLVAPPLTLWQRIMRSLQIPWVFGGIIAIVSIVAVSVIVAAFRSRKSSIPAPKIHVEAGRTEFLSDPNAGSDDGRTVFMPVAAVQRGLKIKVVQTPSAAQKREQVLTQFPCTIGREGANFTIAGDTGVSRSHAEIALLNDRFVIRDLGSTNGTFIGTERLNKGVAADLAKSSTVRLGPHTIIELDPQS